MDSLVVAASKFLREDLEVIALTGKQPNTKFHARGLLNALYGAPATKDDQDLLFRVFTDETTTGIGIVLPPHLVVVDIDGEEGAIALANILGTVKLPETRVASTGRGLHLYFISNKIYRTTKLAEKLDLKATGGYVAAPPSMHPSGRRYQWLDPDAEYAWLPEQIVALLSDRETIRIESQVARPDALDYRLQDGIFTPFTRDGAIGGLVEAVRNAGEGERNNMLNWAAYRAREDGVPFDEARELLGAAAREAGLDDREIRTTIRSAYRAG